MKTLLPPGWPRPKGYSNGIAARGRTIYTAGVIGWDEHERFEKPVEYPTLLPVSDSGVEFDDGERGEVERAGLGFQVRGGLLA